MSESLEVGVGRADITPALAVQLMGYRVIRRESINFYWFIQIIFCILKNWLKDVVSDEMHIHIFIQGQMYFSSSRDIPSLILYRRYFSIEILTFL
ncbi:MAG TPA: hypothetical protein PK733_03250 [Clostridiales bacterium]|nr:hypothetical protein [Clostridiales bacterium]